MKNSYTIDAADAGSRLDAWLAQQLPEFSRSRIQKWIKNGEVMVNEKKVTPHAALQPGDVIAISNDEEPLDKTKPLTPRPDIALNVVYEDDAVVVVNKPSGMIVHPAVVGENDSLANALIAQYPEMINVGDDPQRPGIVHRLDREASGLLVVARTQEAFEALKAQFQQHVVKKEYVVLVDGAPPEDSGTISLAIGRSASGGKMAARPLQPIRMGAVEQEPLEDDRKAVTHYRLEEKFSKTALLTVRTETGRTHQIRVHFNALGCPVVGDALYGLKRQGRFPSSRLFLHAQGLSFVHPTTDAEMSFTAPMPTELEEMLVQLRKQ